MPQSLVNTDEMQIIGGTFSDHENAEKAVNAFRDLGIPDQNIQVIAQVKAQPATDGYSDLLTQRGVAHGQATYYDSAVRKGKTLVVIHGVIDPAPVIDIFDAYQAEYNPDGSRNAREDVLGMTAGAVIGAAAGGVAGAVAAGPMGAIAGAAAGSVIGAGGGAAAGIAAEHNK